ncbi:MAG: 2-oxoacid:acceptor oxidoreductase family protein [Planctomycetota bacterium]
MKTERVIIDGLGGQGVLLAGRLLGHAAVAAGLSATFLPSYGAEVRGGTAHCEVVIAREPVKSPLVERPTTVLLLAQQSFERLRDAIPPGCALLVNSSLVEAASLDGEVRLVRVPASRIADEIGLPNAVNMVMLGAFVGLTGIPSLETMEDALKAILPPRHHQSIPGNMAALEQGGAALSR